MEDMQYSCPGMTAQRRDIPVVPLPTPGEGGQVGGGSTPSIPLPDVGEGGPVNGGGSMPSIPLPDVGEGGPVNGGSNVPVIPLPDPGEGGAVGGGSAPNYGRYSVVRFLNGVSDGQPLRITVGPRLIATRLNTGAVTGYFGVMPSFRVVTLYSADRPWVVLYQASIPFTAGERFTLAVVRSGGGYDLVRVDDRPCGNRFTDRACIRCINLVYNSPGLDVILTDGRVVFSDVRFKEVTTYRRARSGEYDMYIAQTPYSLPSTYTDIETVEDMPMAVSDYYLPGYGVVEPLVSFYVEARAGAMESIYVMGNWNTSRVLRVKTLETF